MTLRHCELFCAPGQLSDHTTPIHRGQLARTLREAARSAGASPRTRSSCLALLAWQSSRDRALEAHALPVGAQCCHGMRVIGPGVIQQRVVVRAADGDRGGQSCSACDTSIASAAPRSLQGAGAGIVVERDPPMDTRSDAEDDARRRPGPSQLSNSTRTLRGAVTCSRPRPRVLGHE